MRLQAIMSCLTAVLLILQAFLLELITFFLWMLILEMAACIILAFVAHLAIKRKRRNCLYAYMLFLAIFMFWILGDTLAIILDYIWVSDMPMCPEQPHLKNITTTTPSHLCKERHLNGKDFAWLMVTCILSIITITLTAIQLRLCFLFNIQLKSEERQRSEPHVTYLTRVPGAPPRYTVNPDPTTISSPPPVFTEAGPLPQKDPLPQENNNTEASPTETPAVPPRERTVSLPPAYSPESTENLV